MCVSNFFCLPPESVGYRENKVRQQWRIGFALRTGAGTSNIADGTKRTVSRVDLKSNYDNAN